MCGVRKKPFLIISENAAQAWVWPEKHGARGGSTRRNAAQGGAGLWCDLIDLYRQNKSFYVYLAWNISVYTIFFYPKIGKREFGDWPFSRPTSQGTTWRGAKYSSGIACRFRCVTSYIGGVKYFRASTGTWVTSLDLNSIRNKHLKRVNLQIPFYLFLGRKNSVDGDISY